MTKASLVGGDEITDVQCEIARRSLKLEPVKDYWTGRVFTPPLLPQNVLVFSRDPREELLLGTSFRTQHHRYVLITAVRGGGAVGVDTRVHLLKEGQSLLVLPFQMHWYVNLSRPLMHWVFVTFEHEADERLEVFRDVGTIGVAGNLELLRDFFRAWQTPAQYELIRFRLAEWLHVLGRSVRKKAQSPDPVPSVSEGGEWVAEINRFVFENRDENISLAQVARRLGVSASLLRSRFRHISGKSIGKYVRELKLQYSCELLHGTKLSISEIAERCGYESVFSFSRAFHRTYKLSPRTYRKNVTMLG